MLRTSITPFLIPLVFGALLEGGQLAYATGTVTGATAEQMQGGLSQGKVIGHDLGSQNPMQKEGGAATSFSASPYGSAPDVGESGFTSNADYKVTFNCATKAPIYIAGNTVRVGDCTTSGTGANAQVQSINLSVCTTSSSGGQCGPTDFSPNTTVFVGQATILTPSTMGAMILSCPADGTLKCTGDLVLRAALAVSGAELSSKGSAAAQGMATQQMLTSTYNNGAYQSEIQTAGPGLNTCYQGQVQSGLESDGTVHTCDGKQSANFVPDKCPPPTEQCVQYATQTNNWNTSCNVDVPIDVKTCNTVTPTKDCAVTMPKQNFSCNKSLAVAVTSLTQCSQSGVIYNSSAECNSACTTTAYATYNADAKNYIHAIRTTYSLSPGNAGYALASPAAQTTDLAHIGGCFPNRTEAEVKAYIATGNSISCQKLTYGYPSNRWATLAWAVPGTCTTVSTYSDAWDDQCTTYESAQ